MAPPKSREPARLRPFAALAGRGRAGRLRRMALAALRSYDIDIARITALTNHFNAIFRVDAADGERYVLRINRPGGRSLADIRSETWWLEALRRDTELVVPEPVPTRDGAVVQTVETAGVPEARHCVLFRWLEGRNTYRHPAPRTVMALGRALATLQDHADTFSPPDGFTRRRHDSVWPHGRLDAIGADEPDPIFTPARRTVLREGAERVGRALERLYADPSGLRFLHADLHLGNVKRHRERLHLLDFDDSVWCFPVQDAAISLYYLQGYPNRDELTASFVAGYTGLRPWPEREEGQIATFMAARELELIGFLAASDDPAMRGYLAPLLERTEERLRSWLGPGGLAALP